MNISMIACVGKNLELGKNNDLHSKDLIVKEIKLKTILLKNEKNKLKREIIKYYKKKITKDELVDFMNKIIESYSKDLTLERQK